jgi:hypothetical protein
MRLFLLAAATTVTTASLLRGAPSSTLDLTCDMAASDCIAPCKQMNLPFDNKHCTDKELLSCVDQQCTMSRSYVNKLMKESGADPVAVEDSDAPQDDDVQSSETVLAGPAVDTPSAPIVEEGSNPPAAPTLPLSVLDAKEKDRLEKIESLINLKKELGEEATPEEEAALEQLLKLQNLQKFEADQKTQAQETQNLYEKEETTIKMEDAEIAELQAKSLQTSFLLGGNSVN